MLASAASDARERRRIRGGGAGGLPRRTLKPYKLWHRSGDASSMHSNNRLYHYQQQQQQQQQQHPSLRLQGRELPPDDVDDVSASADSDIQKIHKKDLGQEINSLKVAAREQQQKEQQEEEALLEELAIEETNELIPPTSVSSGKIKLPSLANLA